MNLFIKDISYKILGSIRIQIRELLNSYLGTFRGKLSFYGMAGTCPMA